MQGAAVIGVGLLLAVMLVSHAADLAGTGVMMVNMCRDAAVKRPRARKRRGYGTRELGEHEKPDEYADKASYGPQPLHRPTQKCREFCELAARSSTAEAARPMARR